MQERIFALKKGTEVPAQFDGVTIPFLVPMGLAEIARVHGLSEEKVKAIADLEATFSTPDLTARNNVVAVHNQAHALNVQKSVKSESMEDGATVEGLRKHAAEFKYGQVRVRGAATGTSKPRANQVANALGEDFLAMLTPEQRELYNQKMAALSVKPKAAEATPETPAATEPATTPTETPTETPKVEETPAPEQPKKKR